MVYTNVQNNSNNFRTVIVIENQNISIHEFEGFFLISWQECFKRTTTLAYIQGFKDKQNMFLIAILLGAITLSYIWLKWNYSYWKRNKVDGPEPSYFVGNVGKVLNFTESFGTVASKWYK